MAEAAAADAVLNVEDQIVARARSDAHRNGVESKRTASFPGNYVVGAGCIAADAESPNEFTFLAVERQTAAEDDHAADGVANHGVVLHSELLRIAEVGYIRIGRRVESVERSAGLRSRIEIAAGQSEIVGAERIRRIGLHRRNHP